MFVFRQMEDESLWVLSKLSVLILDNLVFVHIGTLFAPSIYIYIRIYINSQHCSHQASRQRSEKAL